MEANSAPFTSNQPLHFSVRGTAACTLTISYNASTASGPFRASLLRVGRLTGDPGPINTWFTHPLSIQARVALHESVSLAKQDPSEIGNVESDQPIGAVRLDVPAGDANSCYRLEMTP